MDDTTQSVKVEKSGIFSRSPSSTNSRKGKNPRKRARTKQDFLDFCIAVLEYADYQPDASPEPKYTKTDFNMNQSSHVHDSLGSNSDSSSNDHHAQPYAKTSSTHLTATGTHLTATTLSDEEAITCFCQKPFAGRPMIECGSCQTWIHLSCAKIRRTHIPEVFICTKCREASQTSRKSTRVRTENKKFKKDL